MFCLSAMINIKRKKIIAEIAIYINMMKGNIEKTSFVSIK